MGQDPLGDSCPHPSGISILIQGTTYGEPSTAGTRPTATSSPDPRPTSPSRTSTTQVGAALAGLQPPVPPQPCADPPLALHRRLLAPRPPLLLRRAGEGAHHPHGRGLPHRLPRRAGRKRAPLRPLVHGADRIPPAAGSGRQQPGGRRDRGAGEAPAPPGARGPAVGGPRGGLHEAPVPGQGVLERAAGTAPGLAQQTGEGEDLQAAGHAAVPAA